MNPFKTLKMNRSRLIRNLSYEVNITEDQIVVTMKSAIILEFVISAMIVVIPSFFIPPSELISLPFLGLAFYFVVYFLRLRVLLQFREEVDQIIRKLN